MTPPISLCFYFVFPGTTDIDIVDKSGRVEYRLERLPRSTTTTLKRVGNHTDNDRAGGSTYELKVASESDSEDNQGTKVEAQIAVGGSNDPIDHERTVADVKMHL